MQVIEHDGSLSRKDTRFGDNHTFAPEVWATVASHFKQDKISIETAALARKNRLADAAKANPEIELTPDAIRFSFIETSLYLYVFGENTDGNARTDWVRTLFGKFPRCRRCFGQPPQSRQSSEFADAFGWTEQERLPYDQGFKRSDKLLTISGLLEVSSKVRAATDEGA